MTGMPTTTVCLHQSILDVIGVLNGGDIYYNMLLVTKIKCNILPIVSIRDNRRGLFPLRSYVCVVVILYFIRNIIKGFVKTIGEMIF